MELSRLKVLTDPQVGLTPKMVEELKQETLYLIEEYEQFNLKEWAIDQAIRSGCYGKNETTGERQPGQCDFISEAQRIIDFVTETKE